MVWSTAKKANFVGGLDMGESIAYTNSCLLWLIEKSPSKFHTDSLHYTIQTIIAMGQAMGKNVELLLI